MGTSVRRYEVHTAPMRVLLCNPPRSPPGFAGGTALAAVALSRKEEDKWCQMIGSAFGGVMAATSLEQIPSSVFSFVAFSYVMGVMSERMACNTASPHDQ